MTARTHRRSRKRPVAKKARVRRWSKGGTARKSARKKKKKGPRETQNAGPAKR